MVAKTAKNKAAKTQVLFEDLYDLLTPAEVAHTCRVSRSLVQNWMDNDVIKTVPLPSADPKSKTQLRRIPATEVKRIKRQLKASPKDN